MDKPLAILWIVLLALAAIAYHLLFVSARRFALADFHFPSAPHATPH